ncbi:unnamed protein product, partial [Ixodes pacificus]
AFTLLIFASARVCKKKWTNLKDYYLREHAKVKKTRRSGCGAKDVFTSKWQYFDVCRFLDGKTIVSRRYAILLPRCGVDAADEARRVQLNRRLAKGVRRMSAVVIINPDVFFLDKKQPRRDHFAGDGYHVSHLVGVRALTRLIKVQVARRLGAQWVGDRPRLEVTEVLLCRTFGCKGHPRDRCLFFKD